MGVHLRRPRHVGRFLRRRRCVFLCRLRCVPAGLRPVVKEVAMGDVILSAIVAVLLLVYLTYALLKPERF